MQLWENVLPVIFRHLDETRNGASGGSGVGPIRGESGADGIMVSWSKMIDEKNDSRCPPGARGDDAGFHDRQVFEALREVILDRDVMFLQSFHCFRCS